MSNEFQKHPRYWSTLEEYHHDPEVERLRSEEFYTKPAEVIDEMASADFLLSRRDLLKLTGIALLATVAGCSRRPVEKIIPYVVAPEEITPGVPTYYASVCAACPAGCGTIVKTREGRPIKLEGNPKHPINHGTLCARGQASILDIYDPDRLKNAVEYKRGKAIPVETTIAAAEESIFQLIQNKPERVAVVTKPTTGLTDKRIWNEFLNTFSGINKFEYDPLGNDEILEAQYRCYEQWVKPRYRFEKAEYILSFASDPFATGSSPVEYAYGYGHQRKPNNKQMVKLVVFEPAMSMTGANADERFLVEPQWLTPIAFAIAKALFEMGHTPIAVDDKDKTQKTEQLKRFFDRVSIQKVEETTELKEVIRRIAKEISKHKGRSLVIAEGTASQITTQKQLQIAVNLLNSMLDNDGKTVDATISPSNQMVGWKKYFDFIQQLKQKKFDVVVFADVNPLYHAPNAKELYDLLQNVPTVITLSQHLDETAVVSDWVLPLSHPYETWLDYEAQRGIYAVGQPTITPLYNTKSVNEYLLKWTAQKQNTAKVPTILEYLQDTWKSVFLKDASQLAFQDWWNQRLQEGFFSWVNRNAETKGRDFKLEVLETVRIQLNQSDRFQLVLQTTAHSYDGSQRNNVWLMETPDPVSKVSWDNHLSISPSTAKSLGLATGDMVTISTEGYKLEVPVYIQPGVHPKVAALALGWGRSKGGRILKNVGVNGFALALVQTNDVQFSGIPIQIEKTGKKYKLANMQGHNYIEHRPVVQETTFEKFLADPTSGGTHHPDLTSIWGPPPKPLNPPKKEEIRWWMTIDTNSCIGCNACAVACQAENNIPVVGKEQVLRGREMSWIRIDRYYSGDVNNPEVIHQPMLCQHCSHAPCETVCPVVATTHNDEGLNIQTYNRCVGTRYCSNNCPYKVRRFNWLVDNTPYSDRNIQPPMQMVYNPDVTVRSIGVMEKCTFCIQRIREGHEFRREHNLDAIPDGTVQPACAQTCPTQAITFGNIKNQDSQVTQIAKDPRGYLVLEELNTRPAITYLRKIRHRSKREWDDELYHTKSPSQSEKTHHDSQTRKGHG
ncbi:MAG: TAT-variant-translocated molybdopterin oxidoreductase [bacterium]|nr:TAT-variant-translocated molybdopterin oxidoreductase [bacterium]